MTVHAFIRDKLTKAADKIRQNIVSVGAKASGRTGDSFKVFEKTNVIGLEANKNYTALEEGRGPGKKKDGNLVGALLKWISDKPILMPENQKLGFAISTAIKMNREGSVLFRNGGRKIVYSNVIDEQLIKEIVSGSTSIISKELGDGINGNFKTPTIIKF